MAEYIERETAIAAIKDNKCRKCSDIGLCGNCAVLTAIKLFEALPAADVRHVVICENCKHCLKMDEHETWCKVHSPMHLVRPDDWCSRGEERDDG